MEKELQTYESVDISDSDNLFGDATAETKETKEQPKNDTQESEKTTMSNETSDSNAEAGSADGEEPTKSEPEYIFTDEDGTGYTQDQINGWRDDSDNKKKWNKSNTETAQELANQRKVIDPMVQFTQSIADNSKVVDTIADYLKDEIGEDAEQSFRNSMEFDPDKVANPYKSELDKAKAELAEVKSMQAFNDLKAELKSKYKLTNKKLDSVVELAESTYEETGRVLSLEESYKILRSDELQRELEESKKGKPKPPTKVNKSKGAKKVESNKNTDGHPMTYDDVDVSGFNLFG